MSGLRVKREKSVILSRFLKQRKGYGWKVTPPNNQTLRKIVLKPGFLKDLGQIRHFVHTGNLESYHNLRLKYVPKRIHFSYNGMLLRSIIAIFDYNNNLEKEVIGKMFQFSKPCQSWVAKNRYTSSEDNWKVIVMRRILWAARSKSILQEEPLDLSLPKNIAPVECPSRDIMLQKKFSRFPAKKN